MYGINKYGIMKYAEEDISEENIKKYFVDLSKYVSPVIYNKIIMNAIYDAQGAELGGIYYYFDDLLHQCFIDTATWGLTTWEKEYGIITNLTYSYEDRREVLKAKKRGQGTTTIAMIKNMAKAFSGGEVNIIPHNEDYYFTIQFVGVKGIPRNMQAFISAIEDIKPAHLGYEFKYTYSTWGQLKDKNLTWNGASSKTWDEIKVYE